MEPCFKKYPVIRINAKITQQNQNHQINASSDVFCAPYRRRNYIYSVLYRVSEGFLSITPRGDLHLKPLYLVETLWDVFDQWWYPRVDSSKYISLFFLSKFDNSFISIQYINNFKEFGELFRDLTADFQISWGMVYDRGEQTVVQQTYAKFLASYQQSFGILNFVLQLFHSGF